jgi:hypothetical protein
MQLYCSGPYLPGQCPICPEEKLLSGLSACIKSTGNLSAAKRTVIKVSGVISCKGDSLGNTLINYVVAYLCKAVNVCLSGPEVASFYRVIEKAEDTVAVVGIVLCRINAALRRNAVSAARTVLVAECLNIVAELA